MSGERVLVTGGSGFLGAHTIAQLLGNGYEVHTTVRSMARADDVRAMLHRAGADTHGSLSFHLADLTRDDGWTDAVAGCRYVLHIAAPFPRRRHANDDDPIVTAPAGARRVLRAAGEARVSRVVMTSSFAAVGYSRARGVQSFDENDWTDPETDVPAHVKSKVLAERAAWDFVADGGIGPQLTVINPVGIFGPLLGRDATAAVNIVERLLAGVMPGTPKLYYGVVDVRDVADLHLRAMTHPDGAGERFIATSGEPLSLHEIALILRSHLGADARGVPTRVLPNWLIRLTAHREESLKPIVPDLGHIRRSNSEKARQILGWVPRSAQTTIHDTADSLIELGLVGQWSPAAERTDRH
jgi:nucleoside-diphosphate-sugar epimerase